MAADSMLAVARLPHAAADRRVLWSWKNLTYSAAFVAGVPLFAAVQPWTSHSAPAAVHETQDVAPLTVHVEHPTPASVATVALPATIRPWQATALNARVSGYLKNWNADLGARVKAGQVLAEIETPELDQQVAESEATAREADAAVVQAETEKSEAEAALNAAVAQLARVKAEIALVKSQLARREQLLKSNAIAREEYDTFLRQSEARDADVNAAEAEVNRRRTGLDTRAAAIVARKAAANSRWSNVERLKELQSFQRITAPFDGVVTKRVAEVGLLVNAGGDPLFTLEDMSRVRVQVNVPQSSSANVSECTPAVVNVPESSQKPTSANVTRVASSINATNRTMLAEIELANDELRYQPGSYAQVTLSPPQNGAEWTIPTNTLLMKVAGPHVAVVDSKNEVVVRPVELGRNLGNRVIVTNGIRGDERLIVNPSDELANGRSVRAHERTAVAKN